MSADATMHAEENNLLFALDADVGVMIQYAAMKRERSDGRIIVVHEFGDGIRRRYHEALRASRFYQPRKGLVHHEKEWYLSDKPFVRPLFGIYAFAAYAEDLLWYARFGRNKRPDLFDAATYFAETRHALQNVLSTYSIGKRITPKQRNSMRKVVARLAEGAKKFLIKPLDTESPEASE